MRWINVSELVTALLGAGVIALVTYFFWKPLTMGRKRILWEVLYDEQINQGYPTGVKHAPDSGPDRVEGSGPGADGEMWNIVYHNSRREPKDRPVEYGSLVVLEVSNVGSMPIEESNFEGGITCRFEGREVIHFKIRENSTYRKLVLADEPSIRYTESGEGTEFTLPALRMDTKDKFQVLVLLSPLEGKKPKNGQPLEKAPAPVIEGKIFGGKFEEHKGSRLWPLLAVGGALALVVGVLIGVQAVTGANTPSATCAAGTLNIDGSTAFAPVANQVATDYERLCGPSVSITVNADDSDKGLGDLKSNKSTTPVIAMYDGDAGPAADGSFERQSVGVVIFSIIGNRTVSPSGDQFTFTPGINGGGMREDTIASVFATRGSGGSIPVFRAEGSGTRKAFVETIMGGSDREPSAPSCLTVRSGSCEAQTTMDMLNYVNRTKGAIGYGEPAAVPFFPNVGVIPIGGYLPTPDNVRNGNYPFYATEHLYTKGKPSGLAADFIAFLNNPAELAQLSGTDFIPCQDLDGSKVPDACHS